MKEYSRQPRKQRLANYNKNQHAQMRSMSAHLSDELLKEYSLVRSMTVRKGDTVKVVRGIFKGHTAKVVKVFPKRGFLSIEEGTLTKADGKKVARMFRPSNVILTKMDLSDPWRREKLSRFRTPGKAEEEAAERNREAAEKKEEAAEKKAEAAEEKKALKEAGDAEALAEQDAEADMTPGDKEGKGADGKKGIEGPAHHTTKVAKDGKEEMK
jgi:large subunit ribosomal protein L24